MKKNKKYGQYPGIYKNITDKIDKMSEGELWLQINNIESQFNNIVASSKKDIGSLETLKNRIEEYRYSLEYLISKTSKFGVEIAISRKHIIKNDSYNAWYKWWNDYFNSFTIDEAKEFNNLLENGENVSKYRPKGNWKENIKISKKGRK